METTEKSNIDKVMSESDLVNWFLQLLEDLDQMTNDQRKRVLKAAAVYWGW